MKTNIKKNRIAWVSSSILMALVVVGCVYLDKVNVNQGTEENPIYWTKAGVVRLGFFIKSERAKMFRDWAETVVLQALSPQLPKSLPDAPKRRHNRLSQERLVGILADVARIDDRELRLSLISKLGV